MKHLGAVKPTHLPRGLTQSTVNALGIAIVSGQLAPGVTLPVEQKLADEYGVSRTSLRDAIKVLAGKGLVRTARRYGTRVCDPSEWNMMDADVVGWRLADRTSYVRFQREISDLRALVEPGAAALAAERATAEERAAILALAQRMTTDRGEEVLQTDLDFHLAIIRATHNSLIQAFIPSFGILLGALFRASYHSLTGSLRYDANPAIHVALAVAIDGGRVEEARHIATAILARGEATADRLEVEGRFWGTELPSPAAVGPPDRATTPLPKTPSRTRTGPPKPD